MTVKFKPDTQCHGKSAFADKGQAKRAARMYVTYHPGSDLLAPYRCPHCRWFHLGHRTKHIRNSLRGAA